MTVYDGFGDEIHNLPEHAKCKITGENPMTMEECPGVSDYDTTCYPGTCRFYTEDQEDEDN